MEKKNTEKGSVLSTVRDKVEDVVGVNLNRSNMYKILCIVLMVILIITLGACGITMYSRNQANDAYKELATHVNDLSSMNKGTETSENVYQNTESVEDTEVENTEVDNTEGMEEMETEVEEEPQLTMKELIAQLGVEVPKKNLKWEELHRINPDIYAWLYVPNTEVEYPVLQHPTDDDYYLNRNMDGSWGKPGCIYTESLNNKDFLDLNTIIYGHNMKSGRMFQSIHEFEDSKFFQENSYIFVYTENGVLIYEIFAAYPTDDSHILNTNDFTTVEGYAKYLEKVSRDCMAGNVREDVSVTAMNRILTLSTCGQNSKKRYVVQAVLLNDPLLYGIQE